MEKLAMLVLLLTACAQPVKAKQGEEQKPKVQKVQSELELCEKETVKLEETALHWLGLYNSLAKDELKIRWSKGEKIKVFLADEKKEKPGQTDLYYCQKVNYSLKRSAGFYREMFSVLNGTYKKKE